MEEVVHREWPPGRVDARIPVTIKLKDGREFPSDTTILSMGVHSRVELAKAAGLGRYKDAASGLNRLRNSDERNDGAQGDPGNYNFMDHNYPPVLQRTPLPRTMQFFRQIAQQIPCRGYAPHHRRGFILKVFASLWA